MFEVDLELERVLAKLDEGGVLDREEQLTLHAAYASASERLEAYEISQRTDDLTTLFNRQGMNDIIDRYIERNTRDATDGGLVLAIADLDGFGAANSTYGHGHCDEILKVVAKHLSYSFKVGDDIGKGRSYTREHRPGEPAIGRPHGDEYLIVLPDALRRGPRNLQTRLDLVAKGIPDVVASLDPENLVGMSVGAAAFTVGDDRSSWMRRADDAMYWVKANGKGAAHIWCAENDYDVARRADAARKV